jgi:hypothetical protein
MAFESNSLTSVDAEWPLRLLHIPTMTSIERNENNVYDGVKEPSYNILSYTWGRWELSSGPALPVKCTPWKIPSVDPEHFSVSDFSQVLERMQETHDFAWVDVACIDQENLDAKMDQVEKQAAIFERADRPFIWLNSHSAEAIRTFISAIFKMEEDISQMDSPSLKYCRDNVWLSSLNRVLGDLFGDPWFSSLWTLQEAFLRTDAEILSKEGNHICIRGPATLNTLIASCITIYLRVRYFLEDESYPPELYNEPQLRKVITRLDKAGIYPLRLINPIALYAAAQFRKARDPKDKILGIIQIFGIRLMLKPSSSLQELEYRFGKVLVTKSPVLSQTFIHLGPVEIGKRWCISRRCQVPEKCNAFTKPESHCKITWPITKELRTPIYTGHTCSFSAILELWILASYDGSRPNTRSVENIALDFSEAFLAGIPDHLRQLNLPNDERQHELGELLIAMYGTDLRLLRLGKVRGHASGRIIDLWFGIMAIPRVDGVDILWSRLGICFWELMIELEVSKRESIWQTFEGYLG